MNTVVDYPFGQIRKVQVPMPLKDVGRLFALNCKCDFQLLCYAQKDTLEFGRFIDLLTTEVTVELLPGEVLLGARLVSSNTYDGSEITLKKITFECEPTHTFKFFQTKCVTLIHPSRILRIELDIKNSRLVERIVLLGSVILDSQSRDQLVAQFRFKE